MAPLSLRSLEVVGLGRLELPTSRLSSARSNQLSYKPDEASWQHTSWCLWRDGKRKGNEGGGKAPYCLVTRLGWRELSGISILRKEVIQPQVPLRLPCYDFGPVADPTVVSCLLAVSALPSGRTNSHAVTGGVYKARERIHRSLLFCDY
jgi:hypothetical protein